MCNKETRSIGLKLTHSRQSIEQDQESEMATSKAAANVFQVLCPTRNYGVGARVTRKIWSKFPEPTYWEITRIHPSPDLKHGKVFGRFTFRGASHRVCLLLCALRMQ